MDLVNFSGCRRLNTNIEFDFPRFQWWMALKEWDELENLYKDEPGNATYNMKSQRKGFQIQ